MQSGPCRPGGTVTTRPDLQTVFAPNCNQDSPNVYTSCLGTYATASKSRPFSRPHRIEPRGGICIPILDSLAGESAAKYNDVVGVKSLVVPNNDAIIQKLAGSPTWIVKADVAEGDVLPVIQSEVLLFIFLIIVACSHDYG